MKIKQLRLEKGCHALKAGDNFIANDHTKIERMANGDYMVRLGEMSPVIVSSNQVSFAVCDPEQRLEYQKVPVSELKK